MGKTRHLALLLVTCVAWLATTAAAKAAVFDLSADFSPSDNPNGVWTYGWKTNVTGVLVSGGKVSECFLTSPSPFLSALSLKSYYAVT